MVLSWIATSGGNIPPNAVPGGRDSEGEIYFVGRAQFDGNVIPGKIHSSHECLYLSFGSSEHKIEEYEVLVNNGGTNLAWVPDEQGHIPQCAVIGGHQENGETLYIGRQLHNGSPAIGKIQPSEQALYIPHGGLEHKYQEYEVLIEPLQWVPAQSGEVPENAVSSGTNPGSGETYYVGRVNNNGEIIPGKVHPSHGCLYIPHGGQELKHDKYQVLCNPNNIDGIEWVDAKNGEVPVDAVPAGFQDGREIMYVGRQTMDGAKVSGKVHPSHGCVYVPFAGQEHKFETYQVLVFPSRSFDI